MKSKAPSKYFRGQCQTKDISHVLGNLMPDRRHPTDDWVDGARQAEEI